MDEKKKRRKDAFAGTELGGLDKYGQRNSDAIRAARIEDADRRIREFASREKTLEWAHEAIGFCERESRFGADIATDSIGVQDLPRIKAEAEAIIAAEEKKTADTARRARETEAEAKRRAEEARLEAERLAAEKKRKEEEARVEAARRAAEEREEAARRAAEERAEAERCAAEERAAAARRAEEERAEAARREREAADAKAAQKAAQIRDTDALILALDAAPRSRYWCEEVYAADKQVKALPSAVKVALKNLPKLESMLREAQGVAEAAKIDEKILALKRTSVHNKTWASNVLDVFALVNDDNRTHLLEMATLDGYVSVAYAVIREPEIVIVRRGLDTLERDLFAGVGLEATQYNECKKTFAEVKRTFDAIDYDMGLYVDDANARYCAVRDMLAVEEKRQKDIAAEEARRKEEERRRKEAHEAKMRAEEEARRRAEREAAEIAKKAKQEEERARELALAEEKRRIDLARERARRRKRFWIRTTVVSGIVLALAALVLTIIFSATARPWVIAALIALVYTAGIFLLYEVSDVAAGWVHFGISLPLIPTIIVLLAVARGDMCVYALGLSVAMFAASMVILWKQIADISPNVYANTENCVFLCGQIFAVGSGALLSLAVGLLFFTGIGIAIAIAAGILLTYLASVFTYLSTGEYYQNDMCSGWFLTFDIVFLLTGFIFAFIGLEFCIIGMGLALAALAESIVATATGRDIGILIIVASAIVLATATLTFFFMHDALAGGAEYIIKDGVLVDYYGTEEVLDVATLAEEAGVKITAVGKGAFANKGPRQHLREVVLPEGILTIRESAFKDCAVLEKITLPQSLETIEASAFRGCAHLRSVEIPAQVKELGDYTFAYCSWLETVTLPDAMTKIGDWCFTECAALERIVLPRELRTLSANAFYNSGLCEVELYNKVQYIGFDALDGTPTYLQVSFHGTETEWNRITKETTWAMHWAGGDDAFEVIYHDADCADCAA